MKDDTDFEAALRETLPERARVDEADLQRLRASIASLPKQRRGGHRGTLLGIAAGVMAVLSFGALLAPRLPAVLSNPAPTALPSPSTALSTSTSPSPSKSTDVGDPRLAKCGTTPSEVLAVFDLAHIDELPLHLPAASRPLDGVPVDGQAAGSAVVLAGSPGPDGQVPSLGVGTHDICLIVGTNSDTWVRLDIPDVDTSGLVVALVTATPAPSPAVPSTMQDLPKAMDPVECKAMSFEPDRCFAVVESARQDADVSWEFVERVSIGPWVDDHLARSGGVVPIATVRFTLTSGRSAEQIVWCNAFSGQYSLVCTENPEIQLSSGVNRDVPCTGDAAPGEPGSACATPLPAIEPSAENRAVPLEIHSTDIPITWVGHKEIDMGRATIPNGVLSESTFTLADIHTRSFSVADGIALEVRSLDPSRPPFENIYLHGWYPGTEDVEVYLVLDVTSFTPGAMLQVRDLVVR